VAVDRTLGIAVIGLGFGEAFLPLYQAHPDVGALAIVDPDAERLRAIGDRYGIADRYPDIDGVLADPRWDAVHIVTPVATHAELAVRALRAGKHCACAVPMAADLEGIDSVLEAQAASGKRYMMMETSVYGREFRHVERLHRDGRLGVLTAYRGVHIQDLDGFPRYWQGFPTGWAPSTIRTRWRWACSDFGRRTSSRTSRWRSSRPPGPTWKASRSTGRG
jgi:predicted dehydrogenase